MLTVATLDVVASAEQAAAQAKEQQGQQSSGAQAPPTSLGGLGGALGGRSGAASWAAAIRTPTPHPQRRRRAARQS